MQGSKKFPSGRKVQTDRPNYQKLRSINSLIAEGHVRFTYPDQIHYCVQARGSLAETINHLIDAYDEGYITEEKLNYYKMKGN